MKSLILLGLAILLICSGIGIMLATVFNDDDYDFSFNRQKILKIVGFLLKSNRKTPDFNQGIQGYVV